MLGLQAVPTRPSLYIAEDGKQDLPPELCLPHPIPFYKAESHLGFCKLEMPILPPTSIWAASFTFWKCPRLCFFNSVLSSCSLTVSFSDLDTSPCSQSWLEGITAQRPDAPIQRSRRPEAAVSMLQLKTESNTSSICLPFPCDYCVWQDNLYPHVRSLLSFWNDFPLAAWM